MVDSLATTCNILVHVVQNNGDGVSSPHSLRLVQKELERPKTRRERSRGHACLTLSMDVDWGSRWGDVGITADKRLKIDKTQAAEGSKRW